MSQQWTLQFSKEADGITQLVESQWNGKWSWCIFTTSDGKIRDQGEESTSHAAKAKSDYARERLIHGPNRI